MSVFFNTGTSTLPFAKVEGHTRAARESRCLSRIRMPALNLYVSIYRGAPGVAAMVTGGTEDDLG